MKNEFKLQKKLVIFLSFLIMSFLLFFFSFKPNICFEIIQKGMGRSLDVTKWSLMLSKAFVFFSLLTFIFSFLILFWEKVYSFYLHNNIEFYLIIIACVGLLCRLPGISFESVDYNFFLKPWFDAFKNDRLGTLRSDIGDYTLIYKYLILLFTFIPLNPLYLYKFTSIIFDFLLASVIYKIVLDFTKNKFKSVLSFSIVLLLPNVLLNSAFWGQCDAIFSFFIILSFNYLINKKEKKSVIFFTIAFSFKIQSIFFLPVFIIAILKREFNIKNLVYFPIVYILICLPAILLGTSPFYALFGAYIKQTTENSSLNMNCPNILLLLPESYDNSSLSKSMILITLGVCVLSALIFTHDKSENKQKAYILYSYFYVLIIPFLLPHMHDRYFYLADIFAILFAFYFHKYFYISILSIFSSLPFLLAFLFGLNQNVNLFFISLCNLIAVVLLFKTIYKELDFSFETDISSIKKN